jgi:hypothetical protein
MPAPVRLEHLEPLYELNTLFLEFLQSRVRAERDSLDLPASVHAPLRAADASLLDSVAKFPRALFRVECGLTASDRDAASAPRERDARYHDLAFSILWSARQTSRQSPYQAQFLFGLDVPAIEHLRSLGLAGLAELAGTREVVRCALVDQDWVWLSLLTETRPEARRHLALVALQPGLTRDWPRRRPARPAA